MNKRENITCKFSKFLIKDPECNNVLDIACGNGLHAFNLAKKGWNVTAVDIKKSLEKNFKNIKNIKFFNIDLEQNTRNYFSKSPFNKKFNLIIVFRFLHRPLLNLLPDLLEKNGILIYETFMEGNEKYGKPKNKDYLLKVNELKSFSNKDLKILDFKQGLVVSNNKKFMIQSAVFRNQTP